MKLKTKIIYCFLILTAVSGVIGMISLYQLSVLSNSFEELPEHVTKLSSAAVALDHTSQILYYDEVLTQSVRNYALTGDASWKERYFEHEPLLKKTLDIGTTYRHNDLSYFENISETNDKLVEMELDAISFVDNGNYEQAMQILDSAEYSVYKNDYTKFLTDYSQSYNVNLGTVSNNIDQHISDSLQKLRNFSQEGTVVFQLSLIILIGISIGLGYFLALSIISPFTKIQKNVKQIAKGNFNSMIDPEGPDEVQEVIMEFNKMIQQLQKIDYTKRNITSIVSHELRTPLVPIMGNLEILLQSNSSNLTSEQKVRINKIKERCEFMKNLISDIIDLNKLNEGKLSINKKIISLDDIMQTVLDTHSIEIQKRGIKIIVKIPKIKIDGDQIRLHQVFSNLLANSIKFCNDENGEIAIIGKTSKNNVKITVQDNGRGLEQEYLEKIFDTYYQVGSAYTREHGGTGIGLAVCKGIVESHDGQIWAESKGLGLGTKIHVVLPILKTEAKLEVKTNH